MNKLHHLEGKKKTQSKNPTNEQNKTNKIKTKQKNPTTNTTTLYRNQNRPEVK